MSRDSEIERSITMEPLAGDSASADGREDPASADWPTPGPTVNGVVLLVCEKCKWGLARSIDGGELGGQHLFPARRAGRKVARGRRRWSATVGPELSQDDRLVVTCKCGQHYDVGAKTLRRLAKRAATEGRYRYPIPCR